MGKFDANPFHRAALTDVKLLAGRTIELQEIRFVLRNASQQQNKIRNIILSGDRGVGKTSFLNLIQTECISNNIIPIRIDLTESNSINSNELFWLMFSETINVVFELGFLGGKGGSIDAAIQKIINTDGVFDVANWVFRTPILRKGYLINQNTPFEFNKFIEDLKLMRKEIVESKIDRFNSKTKFLFLVDESQNIYSNSKIIEDIRFIVQNSDLGVGFIFAGDNSYSTKVWENVFGGSSRDFTIINLNYFSDVEAVEDYFKKSLDSIGWTSKEIEETLFYKFKSACRDIYRLTSGKPASINIVASKMFERCMKKEDSMLRFDRLAREEVKILLESSGELDKVKLQYIDGLSHAKQKWIVQLFACELSTFNQIYFYAKFILVDDDFITIDEYREFCQELVKRGIIQILERNSDSTTESESSINKIDFLDRYFYAFELKSDTMKQWLQINSDGKYRFSITPPPAKFIIQINKSLISEEKNVNVITINHEQNEKSFRLAEVVKQLNSGKIDITEVSYNEIKVLYKACGIMINSKERFFLYASLKDESTGTSRSWNVLNYDDKRHALGFYDNPKRIEKYIGNVSKYKSNDHRYELELFIDKIDKPNIELLQHAIIKSGDNKKIGIIIEDKMDDLYKYYLKDSDIAAASKTAEFFYELFENGHDLKITYLNNVGYTFLASDRLSEAETMLSEAKRKAQDDEMELEDLGTKCLVYYNLGILKIKQNNSSEALGCFNTVLDFFDSTDKSDGNAAVLYILEINDSGSIEVNEVKEGNLKYPEINCKKFAKHNIEILESMILE